MTPVLLPLARAADLLLSATGAAARSALDNAVAASDALRAAVEERASAAPTDAADPAPGALAALSEQRCLELLGTRAVGRLAYVARTGVPDIAPVNYRMDGRDVLLRSAPGPKLQAAERGEVVAFEVDDVDEQSATGWSVVVVGRAEVVPEDDAARLLESPGEAPTPWANGTRRHVVRIRPKRISGRRIA
jgi:uncharacterized protein